MNNFINTAAPDMSRAKTVGLNQLTPEPFPVLMVGTRSRQNFFFANRGTLETWSGDEDYSLRVTVGDAIAAPVGSTFSLTVGSEDPITIPFDVDQAGLQNILNDSVTVALEGGVDVISQREGRFVIAYKELGTTTAITADGALLLPDGDAVLDVLTIGDDTHRQLTLLTLTRDTPAQVVDWTLIDSPYAGWSGILPLDSAAAYELIRLNGKAVGEYLQCSTLITVEVLDADGNSTAYYQSQILLRALNYMITALLPIGPSESEWTTPSEIGNATTLTPESQFHTAIVNINNTEDTLIEVAYPSGLMAGARIEILVNWVLGSENGHFIIVTDEGTHTELFRFTRSGDEPNALFRMYADGAGQIKAILSVIPAFAV